MASEPAVKLHAADALPEDTSGFQTPREKRFRALAELVPELLDYLPHPVNPKAPPPCLGALNFVPLCISFFDPQQGPILETIILDRIADQLREAIREIVREELAKCVKQEKTRS